MSGGSMNYLYAKVLHCADFPLDTPEREAFAKHLKLVAQALHDIEWVDSGDYGPGDENAAIRACLRPEQPKAEPNVEYERGFIDGMQKQSQSSVDRAVNRLAQQAEKMEPAAWVNQANLISARITHDRGGHGDTHTWSETRSSFHGVPLYTEPPQRKPLTDEEIEACRQQGYEHAGLSASFDFGKAARAVERALGVKE